MSVAVAVNECLGRIRNRSSWRGLKRDLIINSVGATVIFGASDAISQLVAPYISRKAAPSTVQLSATSASLSPSPGLSPASPGDCSGSEAAGGGDAFSKSRTAVVASQGWLLNGVLLTPFYRALDVVYGATNIPGRFFPGVPLKIITLQVLYMPVATKLFLFTTPFLERLWPSGDVESGSSFRAAVSAGAQRAKEDFREVYVSSWWFWPISDAVNFRLIPVSYRPLWDSVVDVVWTAYLSHLVHRPN